MNFYQLNSPRQISVANYTHYINGFLHPDRIMDEHDFVYIIDGEWEIMQNQTSYFVQKDDVIILHAGEHHYGMKECTPNTHTMYFHISASTDDIFNAVSPEKPLLDTVIHTQTSPRVKMIFQEIIAVWHENTPPRTHMNLKLDYFFNLLLIELLECMQSVDSRPSILARQISTIIAQNPQRFYKTTDFVELFHVSDKTLNKHFQSAYQRSIYRYQIEEKIKLVEQFIIDHPDAKLQTVAMNFGFYDEYHMGKMFKKYTGTTPGAYRRLHIPNHQNTIRY